MQAFIAGLPASALEGRAVASFDTRVKNWIAKLFGWAAGRLAAALKARGADLIAPGEGFLVKATKGPLVEGELERAAAWAKDLVAKK